jgi:5-methyltetrahydropteroyltriglutamate--homocysteine methyltransferase
VPESRGELRRRIGAAAKFIDTGQLCLPPQCGFASTADGNGLAGEEQWAKLRMIVDVTQEVWG